MTTQEVLSLTTPLADTDIEDLHVGDRVRFSGVLLTARDAAHKRLVELIDADRSLPIDLHGQVLYYVGPTPPRPGTVIGSAGPTTGGRMDAYAPRLMALGIKGMIGKGGRSHVVREAMQQHKCVYFGAVGGAGALLSKFIQSSEILAYEDLGTEAIRRLVVEDFPGIVINDVHGNDLYEDGRTQYARGE